MTELKVPLKAYLDRTDGEEDLQRVWRAVQRRTLSESARPARVTYSVAGALALAAIVLLLLWGRGSASVDAGPLLLEGGTVPAPVTVIEQESPRELQLADGSHIELSSGTRLEVLDNTGSSFVSSIRRGAGRFDVRPGGPRRWVVECGLATVEVVGTAFTVQRSPHEVVVAVQRGSVLVRGEAVPGREQQLGAGERLVVRGPQPAEDTAEAACEAECEPDPRSDAVDDPVGAVLPSATAARAEEDRIGALLRRADEARRAGDRARAADLLTRVVREAGDDQRGKVAAFALARLQMEESPEQAAQTLEHALESGMPEGLGEDAMARQVEAYAKAGQQDKAAQAAVEYARKYPAGRRLSEVRRWANVE